MDYSTWNAALILTLVSQTYFLIRTLSIQSTKQHLTRDVSPFPTFRLENCPTRATICRVRLSSLPALRFISTQNFMPSSSDP
jgi:hypothetical protein